MKSNGAFLFLGFIIVLLFVVIFFIMEIDIDKIDFFRGFNVKKVDEKEVKEIIDNEQALFNNIKLAIELKNYEKAKDLIFNYFSTYSEGKYLMEVSLIAGEIFYKEKDYDKAINFLLKASKDNIKEQRALFFLSKIAVEIDRFDPLVYSHLTLAEKEIKNDYIYVGLGYQNMYSKLYEEAIRCFLRVNNEESLKGLARAYVEKGEYEKAIETYLRFFSIVDSKNLQYESVKKAFLKQTLFYANKLNEAKNESFTNYYKILADNFYEESEGEVSMLKLAAFYINKKEYDEARKYLQNALNNKLTEKDEEATFLLAQLYYLKGNKTESYKIFNSFLQKYPLSSKITEVKEWLSLIKKEIY